MEVQVNNNNKYFFLVIVVQILLLFSVIHYYRTKELKSRIDARDAINLVQENKIKSLESAVDSLQIAKLDVLKKADSLELKETYYKNRYYATNKKLKDLLNDYDSSSDDAKWSAFTGAIED